MRLLLIDNFDSFTYNIVQAFQRLDCDVRVIRNNAISVEACAAIDIDGIILGPGPGAPRAAGITIPLIHALKGTIPLFGICLGMQAIGEAFGGTVVRALRPMHGKTDYIRHTEKGLFQGLPNGYLATRYHSLIVERKSLPACLKITAESAEGEIMALRHRSLPIEGVQFHPESVASEHGLALFQNFIYSIEIFKKGNLLC